MPDGYKIVKYNPELKKKVLELQKHLWGPDVCLNRAYFEWKHEQNPYIKEPLIYLARHQGEVVGMRGFWGTQWQAGRPPTAFIMPFADDLVITPEHRNRGLVTMIMKAAFEDLARHRYRYSINLSGGDVTLLGSLTMGWKSAGAMAPVGWEDSHAGVFRYVREAVGRRRFFWRYASARALLAPRERRPFVYLDHSGARGLGRAGRFVSLNRTPRCADMADLVARLPYDGRIRHVRDTEFFAWRFRNPWDEYRFLYWEDRQLEGYLVLQRYEAEAHGNRRVNILDWEATTDQVRSDLLTAAVERGRFAELAIWTITLQEDTKRLLETTGFAPIDPLRTKRGFPAVLVRPLRDEDLSNNWMLADRGLLATEDWDLRMLYRL